MTIIVIMPIRLFMALFICVAVSCGGGPPKGATSVYLTIQNSPGLAVPDELLLNASGDGAPIYINERLPRSGTTIAAGSDGVLGTVTIYVPGGVGQVLISVTSYKDQVERSEGSVSVSVTSGRQVSARAVLSPFVDNSDGSSSDGPGAEHAAADAGVDDGAATDAGSARDVGSPDSPGCESSSFTGISGMPGATVDLTAEGALDWRFWGASGAVSYKRTAGDKISDYTLIGNGPISTHFRNSVAFSWSDGTPMLAVTGVADVMNVAASVGGGASLTVPATATPRTLSVYVGGTNDTGLMEASLSDGCLAGYTASATNGRNEYNVVYRFTFKSSIPGAVLNVRWTMSAGFEGLGLYAATLQ